MQKIVRNLMAFIVASLFVAICIALTLYLPQLADTSQQVTGQFIFKRIISFTVIIMFCSLPIVLILGIFAYFKKITTPSFYALVGLFSIMIALGFVEIFQGIKDSDGEWVPFVAFVAAGMAGYIYWYLAIQRPSLKIQTA